MNAPKYPLAAVFCNLIGAIVIIGGMVMISEVVRSHGSDAAMAFGIGTLLSSALWFAIASALSLLSKIEFSTRSPKPKSDQVFHVRTPELAPRQENE